MNMELKASLGMKRERKCGTALQRSAATFGVIQMLIA
jgi:hypothetical protein